MMNKAYWNFMIFVVSILALLSISAVWFPPPFTGQNSVFFPVVLNDYSATDPMKLIKVTRAEERDASCNDGSPAAYYYRPGKSDGSTHWVIHLQGGGFCYSKDTCASRRDSEPALMTSEGLAKTKQGDGIISVYHNQNPFFYDANHVFAHYCSSDFWSGNRVASAETDDLQFRGVSIVQAIIEDLSNPSITQEPNLDDATLVIFSGTSAGGIGVLNHLDWLAEQLPQANIYGIDDAGWFVDVEPYDPSIITPKTGVQLAHSYWNGKVDASCATAYGSNDGLCYLGEYSYPYISTPLFVQIAQFDITQLSRLGIDLKDEKIEEDELDYIMNFGLSVRNSLESVEAGYSPADRIHGLLTNEKYRTFEIDGYSLEEVLNNWIFTHSDPVKLIEQPPEWLLEKN
jgi:O-palmitoleoyl-L-serine hydrolase